MDRTTRWETEAIRTGQRDRKGPPRPTAKRRTDDRPWVTLREAEAATSIPVNTLRKWVRKADLPSYLESDGDVPTRMVDLDAVIARAGELGRPIAPLPQPNESETGPPVDGHGADTPDEGDGGDAGDRSRRDRPGDDVMIVPVDAWNKMLNQLGNLHEAGQQLAEARERAAKAETEATFLRARLAEMREGHDEMPPVVRPTPAADVPPQPDDDEPVTTERPTMSYWRYVTSGWRERKRRSGG